MARLDSMKKLLLSLLTFGLTSLCLAPAALASGEGIALDRFPTERLTDMSALQSGARLFVNYCQNCHSANYMRYNRMRDIGLSEDQIRKNLMFAGKKVGDTMSVTLDPTDAKNWLGAAPPDLSVIARSRGADWLYTYLRTFYRDNSRPTGWNNLAFPNVGMPHVLWQMQGERTPVFAKQEEHGHEVEVFTGWEVTQPGALNPREYDSAMADLVAFLQWASEPGQKSRVQLGVAVLMFLFIFTLIAWRLNAAYWKDIK
jgi:ubiquinol-cytochrome c reductase cytochrome c1 subunit